MGDEIIESSDDKTKTIPANFNEEKTTAHNTQYFYILLEFLLITRALLIAASIYCYFIKYQAKRKYLLREHLYY